MIYILICTITIIVHARCICILIFTHNTPVRRLFQCCYMPRKVHKQSTVPRSTQLVAVRERERVHGAGHSYSQLKTKISASLKRPFSSIACANGSAGGCNTTAIVPGPSACSSAGNIHVSSHGGDARKESGVFNFFRFDVKDKSLKHDFEGLAIYIIYFQFFNFDGVSRLLYTII